MEGEDVPPVTFAGEQRRQMCGIAGGQGCLEVAEPALGGRLRLRVGQNTVHKTVPSGFARQRAGAINPGQQYPPSSASSNQTATAVLPGERA